jgi:cell wall-associated NlpC family hydrolase
MTLNISRHSHSRDPQGPPTVRDVQKRLAAHGFPPGPIDGIYGARTENAVRAFQRSRRLQVDAVVGPLTFRALGGSTGSSAPRGSGRHLAAVAYKVVTAGYGHAKPVYRFGAEVRTSQLDEPATWRKLDCSEFTQGLATVELGHPWVDGAAAQYAYCKARGKAISVDRAKHVPGALLFIYSRTSRAPYPFVHHVAVSLGDGRTAELRSTQLGSGVWRVDRFNRAALIPGIRY